MFAYQWSKQWSPKLTKFVFLIFIMLERHRNSRINQSSPRRRFFCTICIRTSQSVGAITRSQYTGARIWSVQRFGLVPVLLRCRDITCLLDCKHWFVSLFTVNKWLIETSLYNINLFHIKCDISSNKRASKVDLRSALVLRDTLKVLDWTLA